MGSRVMDTALKAMQRAARAVLKPELKVARARLKNETLARIKLEADLRQANSELHNLRNQHIAVVKERNEYARRASQLVDWAKANRPGDITCLVLTEYMQQGSLGDPQCARMGLRLNPFDRWQINPPLR